MDRQRSTRPGEPHVLGLAPKPVGDASSLFRRLHAGAMDGSISWDSTSPSEFPRPTLTSQASRVLRLCFLSSGSANGRISNDVAELASEISPQRPFFPGRPGGTLHADLLRGLGVSSMNELLRICGRSARLIGNRRARSSGRLVAIKSGKRLSLAGEDVLAPALRDSSLDLALWPFDGTFDELLESRQIVATETYPTVSTVTWELLGPGATRAQPAGRASTRVSLLAQRVEIKDRVGIPMNPQERPSTAASDRAKTARVRLRRPPGMLNVLLVYALRAGSSPPRRERWKAGYSAKPASLVADHRPIKPQKTAPGGGAPGGATRALKSLSSPLYQSFLNRVSEVRVPPGAMECGCHYGPCSARCPVIARSIEVDARRQVA